MAYSAKAVANYILDAAKKKKIEVSNMKLQKLVFFAHAAWMKDERKRLIEDPVMAWPYGPVIPAIYHEFKKFGNSPITHRAFDIKIEGDPDSWDFEIVEPVIPETDTETREYLDGILDRFGKYDALKLSAASHADGGAWEKTVTKAKAEHGGVLPRNLTILDSVIEACGR